MTLEKMISDMRTLATFNERLAKACAPRIQAIARANVSRGVDPSGKPWPVKKDGKQALVHAAQAVTAEADGEFVILKVEGVEYWHQVAKPGASLPQRKMIPSPGDDIPEDMKKAIAEETERLIAEGFS